ncbi:MAG: ribonuclease H [Acidimicrobiia bacterium]
MASFTCQECGASFSLSQRVLDRYPGWTPRRCNDCRTPSSAAASSRRGAAGSARRRRTRSGTSDVVLSPEEVLERFHDGPTSGVFTDGGAVPNPGPGGWGAVYVTDNAIVAEAAGHDEDTTNNRMELTALLEAASLVPDGERTVVYSDSKLAVQTITEWAGGWKARGWKRKTGPVENLDLVRPLYELYRRRSELELRWIAAHSGYRWNEYADALASGWRIDDA